MARRGRAGAALSIAAVGSFFAGCVGTVVLAAFAPALAAVNDRFVSPEYFALMLFGLVAAVVLAHGSVVKAVGMVFLGLLFGIVGTDTQSGAVRYTFGVDILYDGIDFIPVAMGLFGIAEIMRNLDRSAVERAVRHAVGSLWGGARHPSRRRRRAQLVRGLRRGEAHIAHARALRPGRGGGRRRA
jgi:TctA family transporter